MGSNGLACLVTWRVDRSDRPVSFGLAGSNM